MSDEQTPQIDANTQPSQATDQPAFGWTAYAEQINGRFAMIGFMSLLLLEITTGQGFLTWLGLR